MPFEPRIYDKGDGGGSNRPSDEPVWDDAEQLDLPDDLAALAEQLRDDAVYLAECHPADATHEQRELAWKEFVESESPARQPSHPWKWISAAAALTLVFTLGGWAIYSRTSATHQGHNIVANETPSNAATHNHTGHNASVTRAVIGTPLNAGAALSEPLDEQPRLSPASFLLEVSGPELDGMLDLLEEDESGLSI